MNRAGQFFLLFLFAVARPARASDVPPGDAGKDASARGQAERQESGEIQSAAAPRPPAWRTAAALGVALAPGWVLPGAGAWVSGDRKTAERVALWGGMGMGIALAGALPLALSNSSRRAAELPIALALSGAGLFITSKLAEIYGLFGGTPAAAPPEPVLETDIGILWKPDALLPSTGVGAWRVRGHWGHWWGRLALEAAPDGGDMCIEGEAARRFFHRGGSFWEMAASGSFWSVEAPDVHLATTAISVAHRRDLASVSPSFSGSFAFLRLEAVLESVRYPEVSPDFGHDAFVSGTFGFGVYLPGRAGEAHIFYNHRHDGRAGGMRLSISGDGPPGFAGVQVRHRLGGFGYWEAQAVRGTHWMLSLRVGCFLGGEEP